MREFGPRFIIELLAFSISQIILLVFAIIFLKKCIHNYQLKLLLNCIVCFIVFLGLFAFSYKYYLDIPYVVRNEYITAEVTALSFNKGKATAPDYRAIRVRDNNTGKEFRVSFYTSQIILVGDIYEIVYLPHTKMARIIKIIDSDKTH